MAKKTDFEKMLNRISKALDNMDNDRNIHKDINGEYVRLPRGGKVAHIPAYTNWNQNGQTLCGLSYDLNNGWIRVSGGQICLKCERSNNSN